MAQTWLTTLTITDASAESDKSVIFFLHSDPAHFYAEVQLGFLSLLFHGPVGFQKPEPSITS